MGTDRYAYRSKLRCVDPMPKLFFSLVTMIVCLFCESVLVGVGTLLIVCALNIILGGHETRVLLRFLRIPIAFLAIGCLTIIFRPLSAGADALISVRLFGRFPWGITAEYLNTGFMVFFKAMGTISCMYFLSFNTPMTDIVLALERLHVPKLFVELMELIYRFIFVLTETADKIRTAQESRLGYDGFRKSINSLGALASMVFLRAWRRGDRVWSALESRGYTGTLNTLPQQYNSGKSIYLYTAAVAIAQLAILLLERGLYA